MFLWKLTPAQKRAFLALAREYARADRKVTRSEKELLERFCAEMGLKPSVQLPKKPRARWLAAFRSRAVRVGVLLELLELVNVDHDFDVRERDLVFEAAAAFGVSASELQTLANWHDRHREVMKEAERLRREPDHLPPPLPKA